MDFKESIESVKAFAIDTAQTAAKKTKKYATIAKMNLSIYAEEDKIRKAECELGKIYYRDYAVKEEPDTAEYLPWCEKIDESKRIIAELRDKIEQVRAEDQDDIPVAEETEKATIIDLPVQAEAPEEPTAPKEPQQ